MKLQIPSISNQEDVSSLKRFTSQALDEISNVINGNITLGDNISCSIIGATFAVANSQVQLRHGLGRVPTGYLVARASVALSIYDGTTNSDTANIYLKSSVIGNVKLVIF